MTSAEISTSIIQVPVTGLVLQVCLGIGWGKFFSNKDRHPGNYAAYGRLLDALITPWVYVFSESLNGFYFAFVIHCLFQSPRSFWSMSARGWIVDEDAFSNAEQGKTLRRESLVSTTASTDATELSVPLRQMSSSLDA